LGALAVANLLALSLVQVTADYSTRYRYTYDYGDYLWSIRQVQSAGNSPYILAIKDVLYQSQLPGEEIYPYLCGTCAPTLLDAIHSRRIGAMAWTTKEDARSPGTTANPQVVKILAQCYTKMTRGVFIVFTLKPDSPCR
jgi:hypothetical protein